MMLNLQRKNYSRNTMIVLSAIMVVALCIGSNNLVAQNCTANFIVNGGPGIDVCQDGLVTLTGTIGGDATKAVWRGGKGRFEPDRNALRIQYFPDTSEIGRTIILILVASNPSLPDCPPVHSEVKITVNENVKADVGANQRICSGEAATMHGSVKGHPKETIWGTNGSGRFNNPYDLQAVYTPSEQDIKTGAVSLFLSAQPYGVCQPDTAAMILEIGIAPKVNVASDISVEAGQIANLDITTDAAAQITWRSHGSGLLASPESAKAQYRPSKEDIKNGTVQLSVNVSFPAGNCSVNKEVTLHIKSVTH